MFSLIALGIVIVGGATWTMFNPILLPPLMVSAITDVVDATWILDGFLPMGLIYECLQLIVWVLIIKKMIQLVLYMVAQISGGEAIKI